MNQTLSRVKEPRQDTRALWGGIIFSFLFTGLIWLVGGRLDSIELLPDTGASWYYWKLPEPTFWTRATAWGFYLAHQFVIWGLIYVAQKRKIKYTTGLHKLNWLALGANGFFIVLHLLQTHLWYDGLAQDVSIWSSQVSVIILLVWVLLMENSRRGLFFGKKVRVSGEINRFARQYHGYFFAWATIYTFWYHPMVSTPGHLVGFVYMFLLLLQGSLFFTRIHLNKWWTFFQEFIVLVHGTIVAVFQGNNLWPMFAFGFGGMFIITQMHGLGLSKTVRWLLVAAYVGLTLWVYNGRWAALNEIVRIPFIEYLSVFVLAGIFWLILRIIRRFQSNRLDTAQEYA
ncbi:MAG: hypothetical protein H6667_04990 [Ardenticatenaceae bacterium]|nr:hypothetical protein [Ardenticatenaceae bacterium]MCB9445429.1 hypothetical protein [Ardenticatenaceae bacterium]